MKKITQTSLFKLWIINIVTFLCITPLAAQLPHASLLRNDSLLGKRLFTIAYPEILRTQALAKPYLKSNPYAYFRATYQLGQFFFYTEKYDSAVIILSKLSPIITQSIYKDSLIYGEVLNLIGINHRKLRQFKAAEAAYLKAQPCLKALSPLSARYRNIYGSLIRNFTILYSDMGRTDEAIDFGKQALDFEVKGTDKYFTRLNTLALAYKRKGRFKEAIQMTQMILNQTDTNNIFYALRLLSVSSIYADIQLLDKALALAQQSKRIVEKTSGVHASEYANANNNLSLLHFKMGQDSLALEYALAACRVAGKLENQINYHQYLSQLADCYYRIGKTNKALNLAEKSVQYLESHGAKQAEPYFWATETLIRIYQKMNLLENAIALNEATLSNFKTVWSESEDKCLNSTMRLIQLYQQNQQWDKSTALLKTLAHTMNTQIIYNLDVLDEESKSLFINKLVKEYHDLLFSQLQNARKKDNELIRAAYQAELAMKGVILGSTQIFRQMVRNSKDTTIQQWDKARVLLNQKIEKAYSQQSDAHYTDSLKKVLNILEAQLMTAMPELKEVQRQNIDFEQIRAALPSNACAIEFTHFRHFDTKKGTDSVFYGAIIIRPNQSQPKWVSLCSEKKLYDLLQYPAETLYAARGAVLGKKLKNTETQHFKEPASALYRLIWKPLEAHLSKVQTVYYAPSGLLHRVSFAALQGNEQHLLLDKHDLQAVHSTKNTLSVASNLDNSLIIKDKNAVLIYGGIQYDADSVALANAATTPNLPVSATSIQTGLVAQRSYLPNTTWNYLEGTKLELERISKLFTAKNREIKERVGFAASEEDFKKQALETITPSIIHFATHGFFHQNTDESASQSFQMASNPLIRSGLVMAGANRVGFGHKPYLNFEDGILTAYEISLMNLSNTKLVVLSACETGLGDIQGSEGVYGLQRAFKMAGVEKILMSLWQVPDEQTAELMEKFYTYLLENQPIQTAFANAQQAMKVQYPPYYWAGFVLMQ